MRRKTRAMSWGIVWLTVGAACAHADENASDAARSTHHASAEQAARNDDTAGAREDAGKGNNADGWIAGTWNGMRRGYPVTWRFQPNGRAYVEDRSATWSVANDTLRVDFDPIGESNMIERAVYRCLVSNAARGPRRMFLLGFDLGNDGLLLTREFDPNDPERATDTVDRSTPPSIAAPQSISSKK